jgi:pyrimidine-nucleoside phosphorylase
MALNPAWIIQRKRDGQELSKNDLKEFIQGVLSGEVADYQASAFLMAVFFRGMTLDETVSLTEAMLNSGERYDLSRIKGPKVDKHSTGGVGDKTSIIVAPLAAACGLKVPMMSGRGLGHTGGTLDKLESIPGFSVNLDRARFESVLTNVGCAMIGQSASVAPADKKLYALRDVTGTVECIPLIVASILSKKLSEGTEALVFDVKVGSGAFMKTKAQAKQLAKMLISVSKKLGVPARALLTDMEQPLGCTAGNSIEIRECIAVLRNEKTGDCSVDLKELSVQLCAHMLVLGKLARDLKQARILAQSRLADGSAWKHFELLVESQGGSLDAIRRPETLAEAPVKYVFKSKRRGFVQAMETEALGKLLVEMGGGRKKVTDSVDPSVGMIFHKKLGSKLAQGDPVVTVYAPQGFDLGSLEAKLVDAIKLGGVRKPVPKLVLEEF